MGCNAHLLRVDHRDERSRLAPGPSGHRVRHRRVLETLIAAADSLVREDALRRIRARAFLCRGLAAQPITGARAGALGFVFAWSADAASRVRVICWLAIPRDSALARRQYRPESRSGFVARHPGDAPPTRSNV